jgi:hypothetical protein
MRRHFFNKSCRDDDNGLERLRDIGTRRTLFNRHGNQPRARNMGLHTVMFQSKHISVSRSLELDLLVVSRRVCGPQNDVQHASVF